MDISLPEVWESGELGARWSRWINGAHYTFQKQEAYSVGGFVFREASLTASRYSPDSGEWEKVHCWTGK
ncbi:hypothetical protein ACQEU8_02320 [Streptomyces sp. CA-250714]|uniref:hypothetical protein n=1 Tax=Streptomyces sp. CA-250714 TaxID=3240060 RepID=UPI003D8F0E54